MTAVLVTLTDAKAHLRVTATGDDALIQSIIDPLESLFLAQAGRSTRPFATAATGVVEVKDGTGTPLLMLDYPIAAITSIKIGRDFTAPVETLDPTNVQVIVFATGGRAVWRTDGGVWGELVGSRVGAITTAYGSTGFAGQASNGARIVQVTYDHAADLPDSPKLAIKRAVAGVYRQIGSEDAQSERLPDGYSRVMAEVVTADPMWTLALLPYEPNV